MRLGCLAVLGAIFLLGMGGQGIKDAVLFRKRVDMPCSAFLKNPPQEGWYHLTGCEMAMDEASYSVTTMNDKEQTDSDGSKAITDVYLPVHAAQADDKKPEDGPITLVMKTDDTAVIGTLKQMDRLQNGSPEAAKKWAMEHLQSIFLRRDVSGMVQAGLNSDDSTHKKIAELQGSVAPNYVILQEGKTPSLGMSLLMFLGGLVLAVISLAYWGNFLRRLSRR